jgi:phage terminase large subunit
MVLSGNISINFKPSNKQFKAWQFLCDKKTLFIGYGGSAFSGKSYLMCYWLTTMCIAYPETSWGLGRKELVTLKKTTLVTLFKVFKECNITDGIHYSYNQQLNYIRFTNGSYIYLIDMAFKPSDPLYTRFGGLELTGAAIDESAESNYSAIEILFTRLGRKNNHKYGLCKKMLETFNPAKNHVYKRYYKPYVDGNLKDNTVFISALPKDNPSPEVEDYVNGILSTADKITVERLIYGNFEYDDDPAKLIEYDSIIDLWSNSFVEHGEKYITADIARFGSDKIVIGVWSGFRLIQIVVLSKIGVDETAKKIKDLATYHKVPISNIICDEDGVGGGVVDILKCKGFVNNSKPIKEKGKDVQYQNLKTQCYFHLAEVIGKAEMHIEVSKLEIDQAIIEELEQVKRDKIDEDGKLQIISKDKIKAILGRSPDFSDMLMMRMWFKIQPKKEIDFGW